MSKILIVDDSKVIARMLSEMLTTNGYEVLSRQSVDDAIAAMEAEAENVRLVITDLIMPDRDGIELIEYIHDNFAPVKRPKIVVISGGSKGTVTAETAVATVKDKVQGVLIKPFSQEVLLETVKGLL